LIASARRKAIPTALVLVSSCWLELFDGGKRAALYEGAVARPAQLVVPVVTVYEVCKYLTRVISADWRFRQRLP